MYAEVNACPIKQLKVPIYKFTKGTHTRARWKRAPRSALEFQSGLLAWPSGRAPCGSLALRQRPDNARAGGRLGGGTLALARGLVDLFSVLAVADGVARDGGGAIDEARAKEDVRMVKHALF